MISKLTVNLLSGKLGIVAANRVDRALNQEVEK